jgi:hypothetical protein
MIPHVDDLERAVWFVLALALGGWLVASALDVCAPAR